MQHHIIEIPTLLEILCAIIFCVIWSYLAVYSVHVCVDYERNGSFWTFIIVFLSPFVAIPLLYLLGKSKKAKQWQELVNIDNDFSS